MRAFSRTVALGALLGCASACSADAVEEAPPKLETPGAFVARERESGGYRLFRTRGALVLDAERNYLVFDEHFAGAASLAEAKEKVRDPSLLLQFIGPYSRAQFERVPYEVIWYRSMSEEERTAHGGL
jgi:hypothetical protein